MSDAFQQWDVPEERPYDHVSHPEVIATLTVRGVGYVESEPHLGQIIHRHPDGTGHLSFRCPPGELDWFARYFAGLGTEAQVQAPAELRERLAHIGYHLMKQYQER